MPKTGNILAPSRNSFCWITIYRVALFCVMACRLYGKNLISFIFRSNFVEQFFWHRCVFRLCSNFVYKGCDSVWSTTFTYFSLLYISNTGITIRFFPVGCPSLSLISWIIGLISSSSKSIHMSFPQVYHGVSLWGWFVSLCWQSNWWSVFCAIGTCCGIGIRCCWLEYRRCLSCLVCCHILSPR